MSFFSFRWISSFPFAIVQGRKGRRRGLWRDHCRISQSPPSFSFKLPNNPPHPLGPGLFLLSAQGLPNTCCTYLRTRKAMLESFGKEKRGSLPGESGGEWKKIFLTAGSEFVPQGDLSSPFSRRLLPRLYLLSFMPPPISLTATDEGRKMRLRHSNKSSTSGPKRKVNLFSSSPPFESWNMGNCRSQKKNRGHESFPFVAEIKFRSRCFSKPKMRLGGGKQLMVLGGVT